MQHSKVRMKGCAYICALSCLLLAQTATAATRLPFRSNFETGNFSEWNGGLDPTMSVTSQDASSGTYSVQSIMTLGSTTDNYKDFVFGDHILVGGQPVTRTDGVWLEFDSKLDQGLVFATGATVHKIIILNLEDENGRRRYQLILNVMVGTREYYVDQLKWNADRSFNRTMLAMTQNVGVPAQVRFGQWDRIKIFARPNTVGVADGEVRLWVNDQLKAEYTNVSVREDSPYAINKLIMSNYVNTATASGIQRWDNFYLGITPPSSTVTPRPPTLIDVR